MGGKVRYKHLLKIYTFSRKLANVFLVYTNCTLLVHTRLPALRMEYSRLPACGIEFWRLPTSASVPYGMVSPASVGNGMLASASVRHRGVW